MAIQNVTPMPSLRGMQDQSGRISTAMFNWLQSLLRYCNETSTFAQQPYTIDFTTEYPQNQTYDIEIDALNGYTITKVESFCRSGTCTATVNINGTPLGGGSSGVTGSLGSVSHTSANVVGEGDTVTVDLSSVTSTCNRVRLCITVQPN